jgi:hypothetical protein
MERKKALIVVELVDESFTETDENIKKDLLDWFNDENHFVPWVKTVKQIALRNE